MDKGIEFIMLDGKVDSYDPINIERDFIEEGDFYLLNMVYSYKIEIALVKEFRIYELCEKCGREVFRDQLCDRCYDELQDEKKSILETQETLNKQF